MIDDTDHLKIVDFGVASILDDELDDLFENTVGSRLFFAPELCEGGTVKGRMTDIWASGITLFFMLFNKYPFGGMDVQGLY
jgi:serine/threonine protein kinase